MRSSDNVQRHLGALLDSALTLRFVIAILSVTITLSVTGGGLVWQAARYYDALNSGLQANAEAIGELKATIATKSAARDLRDGAAEARLSGLEQRVSLLEWRADHK